MSESGRLDVELVRRGLVPSRTRAAVWARAGQVLVNGAPETRPSALVSPSDRLEVRHADPWVSRAAHKLLGALDGLGWDTVPPRVLDAGASTGGFTQVLLTRGALDVYAVDVGHDQLDPTVRHDPRVHVREGLNLRGLTLADLDDEPVDLVVADVSFISLRMLLEPLLGVLRGDGIALIMVKPQFEVGRQRLGHGGVVRDEALRREVVDAVVADAARLGWAERWRAPSVLPGPSGNVEFFVELARG